MPRLELSVRNASALAANFRDYPARAIGAVKRANRDAAAETHDLAYFLAPVDTSFMRDHLREFISAGGLVWEVGFDVMDFVEAGLAFYPFFVEYGTKKMAAQPFLHPAYEDVRPRYRADLRRALRSARRGVPPSGGRR